LPERLQPKAATASRLANRDVPVTWENKTEKALYSEPCNSVSRRLKLSREQIHEDGRRPQEKIEPLGLIPVNEWRETRSRLCQLLCNAEQ
jgi:hypothetical protein